MDDGGHSRERRQVLRAACAGAREQEIELVQRQARHLLSAHGARSRASYSAAGAGECKGGAQQAPESASRGVARLCCSADLNTVTFELDPCPGPFRKQVCFQL